MILRVEGDPKADAMYIRFSDKPVKYTVELDDNRYIDYAHDNTLRGIELLAISDGVNLDDIPRYNEVSNIVAGWVARGISLGYER